MQTAIITATNQQVEIIAVNGGWTTVHTLDADTREMKVRNGALSRHVTLSGRTAELARKAAEQTRVVRTYNADGTGPVAAAKAAKAAIAKATARAKMDIADRKNGKVDPLYLPQYTTYTAELADGTKKRSIDKGDAVAIALRALTLDAVYARASVATGLSQVGLRDRFAHLNPGMQRMNLGNMIRKAMKEAANA